MNQWARVTFGEMAEHVAGRAEPTPDDSVTYVGLEHLDSGSLTVRRWGSDAILIGTKLRMRKGDILFAKRNAYLRRVALAPFDGLFSAHGMVLRARPDVALPEFLPFFMQSNQFMDRAEEISVGSLSPTINWGTLKDQEFRIPPLEDQRRVAAMLASHLTLQEATRGLALASKQAHRALRMTLFGGDLPKDDSETRGYRLSPAWGESTIGVVAEFLDGRRIPLKDSDRSARQGPYPYYGASGVIDHIDDFIFDEELLLVSEDGANLVDRSTAIAFLADGKYWVNNHAHVLRAKPPYSNFLLCEYIESLNLRPYITGTAQPKLNKAALESIRIPKPVDAEMRRIELALHASVRCVRECEQRAISADGLVRSAIASVLRAGERPL